MVVLGLEVAETMVQQMQQDMLNATSGSVHLQRVHERQPDFNLDMPC